MSTFVTMENQAFVFLISFEAGVTAQVPIPAYLPYQVTESEPSVMWLSGLHIPESYLTALVQATCRRNGWPLDHSTLFTQVTKFQDADEVNERAGQGTVRVTYPGLQLGLPSQNHHPAQWDEHHVDPIVPLWHLREQSFPMETSRVTGWMAGRPDHASLWQVGA